MSQKYLKWHTNSVDTENSNKLCMLIIVLVHVTFGCPPPPLSPANSTSIPTFHPITVYIPVDG